MIEVGYDNCFGVWGCYCMIVCGCCWVLDLFFNFGGLSALCVGFYVCEDYLHCVVY